MLLDVFLLLLQITNLRARGQHFLDIPDKYYENLRARLKLSSVIVKEDLDVVSFSYATEILFAEMNIQ